MLPKISHFLGGVLLFCSPRQNLIKVLYSPLHYKIICSGQRAVGVLQRAVERCYHLIRFSHALSPGRIIRAKLKFRLKLSSSMRTPRDAPIVPPHSRPVHGLIQRRIVHIDRAHRHRHNIFRIIRRPRFTA